MVTDHDMPLGRLISESVYSVCKRLHTNPSDVRPGVLAYAAEIQADCDWLESPHIDEDDYQSRLARLRKDLHLMAEKEARKVRAKQRGYHVDDEAYYSLGHLKDLLEVYYQTGITEHPPAGFSESVRHEKGDGSEVGNFLASLLDLESGLESLTQNQKNILRLRYGYLAEYSDEGIARMAQSEIRDLTGWHWESLRATLGDSGAEVGRRVRLALSALQRALGGRSPWSRSEVLDALSGP